MQGMYTSATLKLTAWYLAILMTISITFSIVIYQLNYREISFRLENLQRRLIDDFNMPGIQINGSTGQPFQFNPAFDSEEALTTESHKAAIQMVLSLVYINLVVLVAGGLGSYFLARRTLKPIADAHEAQSRFSSDASHELRTPLAAMKAELEVYLRDKNLTIEEARELLESNLEEVNKLSQLSEMLLQLSRLEHDTLEFSLVDVSLTLEELIKRYEKDKKRFDITLHHKIETYANEIAVAQLMAILIDNALKYSTPKSKIVIRVFKQQGNVGFEIKSKGEQIPEDKLLLLFDRFYRADTSRTNGGKSGYGLGLSIAQKIVDVHHGKLTVSSTNEFTTFSFYLPIIRKPSAKTKE